MTADELRKAEARYKQASLRAEEAREARNATVLRALADGWTHAAIADATGLTRGRIGQIAATASGAATARIGAVAA